MSHIRSETESYKVADTYLETMAKFRYFKTTATNLKLYSRST